MVLLELHALTLVTLSYAPLVLVITSILYEPLEVIFPFLSSPQWPHGMIPSDRETSPRRCPGRKTLPLDVGREREKEGVREREREEKGVREKG